VTPIRVDDARDPRLEAYARLGSERDLVARGVFVAEGRFVVARLCAARPEAVRSVLCNEAALAALGPTLARLDAPVYVCAPRFFEALTGHHFHRGCLALAARPPAASPLALVQDNGSLVVLDRVVDPDNVGSVFRSAHAFGVGAVWLGPGSGDALSRKAIRSSMAATLQLPFARFESEEATRLPGSPEPTGFLECLGHLRARGFELLALSPHEPGIDITQFRPSQPSRLVILIGSEGEGLSAGTLGLATRHVRIGMRPGVDSLNLGVAAGIALHALMGSAARPPA
jgi:tRNA G18 (ribose-2'-O)-methylase SpoU